MCVWALTGSGHKGEIISVLTSVLLVIVALWTWGWLGRAALGDFNGQCLIDGLASGIVGVDEREQWLFGT